MKTKDKVALVAILLFFALSILFAIEATFVSLEIWESAFFISAAFCFYFFLKNPKLLVAQDIQTFDELLESAKGKKFLHGSTPLYPAILLFSIVYIVFMKYGWPF